MSRSYFYVDEGKLFNRLIFLKELVSEQLLRDTPCPLLESQLVELQVFCDALSSHIKLLLPSVRKANEPDE